MTRHRACPATHKAWNGVSRFEKSTTFFWRKRKARTRWDTRRAVTRATRVLLCGAASFVSARKKIHFTRPNGDSTFIQTSRSHKMLNSLYQLSWAICSKRSLRSVLAIVRWERLFRRCCKKRYFDYGRFWHLKRVMRAHWWVFASPKFDYLKESWLVWTYEKRLSTRGR